VVGGLTLHPLDHVAVDVESHIRIRVAQTVRDDLRMLSGLQCEGSPSVAEIMKAKAGERCVWKEPAR
jgi:hypothetical protein